jgi:hypothetical protein
MRGLRTKTISLLAAALLLSAASLAEAGVMSPGTAEGLASSGMKLQDGLLLTTQPPQVSALPMTPQDLRVNLDDLPLTADGSPAAPRLETFIFSTAPRNVSGLMSQTVQERQNQLSKPTALGDTGTNESGAPLGDFSYLSIGPSAFALLRSGTPQMGVEKWMDVTETALSYVQPHRHLQFTFDVERSQKPVANSLSAPALESHSQLIDSLKVDVDSEQTLERSASFGQMTVKEKKPPSSGRMLAIGLDMGLLPAVLGQVGISAAVVVGRSSNPGPYFGMVTSIEFPSDPVDQTAANSPHRSKVNMQLLNDGTGDFGFGAGNVSGAGAGTGSTTGTNRTTPNGPIPITPTPVVPEPATMFLLGAGAVILSLRKRLGKA